jgi:glycosyltransferase involved in cell wall biosynthesis
VAASLSFCMATTFYPPYSYGGDAIHVYRLTNALARRGHRVTVVHSRDAHSFFHPRGQLGDFPNEPGVTVHTLGKAGTLAPLTTYLTGRPGLYASRLKQIFDERFDVIHFHNPSLIGGPGVLSYGDGVKLFTLNEYWLVCPMHVLMRYNREPCVQPQCLRCSLSFGRPPQLWRYTGLLERSLRNVDLFLSPSRFTVAAHRSRGFDGPMRRLPHFVPLAEGVAEPSPPDRSGERPYFLYVGRLVKLKGVHTLIERFRDYEHADLLIAGDGNYRHELRRLADGLDNVRFLDQVHGEELKRLYAGALATIVPSLAYEAFPVVLLEAFSQGTPVIVRDVGALPEPVEESGGGIVYRSQEDLRAAMERIRTEPALRAELAARAHATWRARWTDDAHLDGYFAAIDEARALAAR